MLAIRLVPRGWTDANRRLIAGLVLLPAVVLLFVSRSSPPPARSTPSLRLDPNTAPRQVILTLPRFGPSLTDSLIRAREDRAFRSLDDLDRRVRGVGPSTVALIRPLLRFDATP